ncbi:MAG TPA: hypothetical protein PKN54_02305 [Candidatus Cloacimonas acidaminovorans]|nr:hypothetical protein [Candidatus Cloacimonas acidaminovorans]
MSFLSFFKGKKVEKEQKSVPFHFEVHGDSFFIVLESVIDKSSVFDLFFKGVKRLRQKTSASVDSMPDSFIADSKQLKALESLVINKHFIEDIIKQVRKDIPSFKILSSNLSELSWNTISIGKYKQKIKINGICYYEE